MYSNLITVQFVGSEGRTQLARLNVRSLKQAIEWALQVGQAHHKLTFECAIKCRLVFVGDKIDGSDKDESFFLIDGTDAAALENTLAIIVRKLKGKNTPLVWLDLRARSWPTGSEPLEGKLCLSRAYVCEGN